MHASGISRAVCVSGASNARKPFNWPPIPQSVSSICASKANPRLTFPRLKPLLWNTVPSTRTCGALFVSGSSEGASETYKEDEPSDSNTGATLDTKLPRRRLLLEFTCNECGTRTQRLINPLAYERGLVYVQCAGCLRHHKLVDNLGLVVEYDLGKNEV